ncbi:MAG: UvrD-helicase domain-containing protein [Planctomycetota bacterium]
MSHLLIRASAGSGKTFQLSNRFLALLAAGEPGDTILATTFTRAAAAEIQDRVLLRLAVAALDDNEFAKLDRALEVPGFSLEKCRALLSHTARNLHRLRISTLDSFFIQIAQGFSWELGLPAGWRILDQLEDNRLREQAIAAVLADDDRATLNRLIQWLTKGEAQRSLGELLSDTVATLYELYRETDREAWQRIKQPKGQLSDAEVRACIEALRRVPMPANKNVQKGHQSSIARAEAGDWEKFATAGIAAKIAADETSYYRWEFSGELLDAYTPLLGHVSALFLGKVAQQTQATYDVLERFERHYERLKRNARGALFGDITHLVGKWLSARSAAPLDQVAFRLDAHLNHLLLDEFQDTSMPQWQVLRPLARRVTDPNSGGSFFCVGDTKQAIYGWRGGIAEIFQALEQELTGLDQKPLDQSRRSSPVVINLVNRVFRDMTQHNNLERAASGVQAWSKDYPEHTTAMSHFPGYVALETGPESQASDDEGDGDPSATAASATNAATGSISSEGSNSSLGSTASASSAPSDFGLAADDKPLLTHAAERIRQLVAQSPGATIGVLVRSNATIAKLIFRLGKLGVPASEEGGNPLVDSAAVQLVLSALEFADHPGHSVAHFHLRQSRLAADIALPPHRGSRANFAAAAAAVRQRLVRDGYGRTVEHWAGLLAPDCDAREWRRLCQLVSRAYVHDRAATLRASEFVAAVRAERAPDPSAADVRVTTIHKSKGLQYDIVVLPELDTPLIGQSDSYVTGRDGATGPIRLVCRNVNRDLLRLLPSNLQELFDARDRQDTCESLCVLYVALTRAVHALHLITSPILKPEKSGLPKTFAGLLRAALTDGKSLPPLTTVYQDGDPNWFAKSGRAAPTPHSASGDSTPALRLAPLTGPRRRGLDRVAPSDLEGTRQTLRLERTGGDGLAGRQRGILIHAWMEQIGWLRDGLPTETALRQLASRLMETRLAPAELSGYLADFHAALAQPAVAAVLDPRYYADAASVGWPATLAEATLAATNRAANSQAANSQAANSQAANSQAANSQAANSQAATVDTALEVFRERRFAVRSGDQLIAGTVDRLVLLRRGEQVLACDIVDFKTDALPTGNSEAMAAKVQVYAPQLEAYREAVARSFHVQSAAITARLVFLSTGEVRRV